MPSEVDIIIIIPPISNDDIIQALHLMLVIIIIDPISNDDVIQVLPFDVDIIIMIYPIPKMIQSRHYFLMLI